MAARKGKGRQAVRNSGGGFPTWAAVLVGLLIGAVAVVVLMRHSLMPMAPNNGPQANPQATAAAPSDAGAVAPGNAESAPKKPQFDFYSVLSEKEVRIPDAELSAQAKAEQQQQSQQASTPANTAPAAVPAPAAQPAAPVHAPVATQNVVAAPAIAVPQPSAGSGYLLQVGAFPNPADAETMKARLAMQGFVANVQSITINGQAFHRVRLGPFPSASALEATKQRLSSAGISSIALKEGK
jgi:cell division protein FtsN